ncbi:alpha subunit of pyruvate dehydrogenase [Exophiala sideris]|uniref:Alpha subunit of pyruvate dehydrogenase n=1 Tax=Exophiala sideris TaxID=1016849 RepID=A0ABR0IZ45_9EURO|nr:alpha subunit of pyruvate dehydrogenase [Exophiala sideris]KAK5051090.1 alpha subunit of pyruvate dehydrogenase [Exophiala sideris]
MDSPPLSLETTKKELRDLYRHLWRIRHMEMAINRLYLQRKVRGFCHLSIGQEAVAVGIEHGISRDDKLITAYRCHGNVLMRGAAPREVIGEVLGRREGVARGKGGSVHMYYKNFYGGNGIVGAQVPIGAGLAFAQQYLNTKDVTISLYGDGAANQGQVFEAFNMAKLWNLPVIFGCENNMFGMGTSAARSSASVEYFKRGQYIPGLKIDAMNVLAVLAAVKYGKEYVLSNGPLVYEFACYRYFGHSVSDPGTTYRTRDDIQAVRKMQDPINNFHAQLSSWGIADEEELKKIEKDEKAMIEQEVVEAEKMPFPDVSPRILFEDSYVRGSEPLYVRGRTPEETFYFE